MLGVVIAGTATRHGRIAATGWKLVGRPRPSVEDILISILSELLFSSTTLPFRVRWYSDRIMPPTHLTMMRTGGRRRRVALSLPLPLTRGTHQVMLIDEWLFPPEAVRTHFRAFRWCSRVNHGAASASSRIPAHLLTHTHAN